MLLIDCKVDSCHVFISLEKEVNEGSLSFGGSQVLLSSLGMNDKGD